MTFRVPEHVHHRKLDDEVLLLDSRSDAYLGLNASAAVVWDVLASGGTADAAATALVERFEVGQTDATQDVAALAAELVERGLLETAG